MSPRFARYGKRFNCSNEQLIEKGILDAMQSNEGIDKRELLQALIMFNVDILFFISMLPENEQKQLNSIIVELAESGKIKPYKIPDIMQSDDFKSFLREHEDIFEDYTLTKVLNQKKDIFLSKRILKILVKESTLDACLYYYGQGKITDNVLELKKQVIARKKAISDMKDRIRSVDSIDAFEYTEADKQVLIRDLSAGQFYDRYKRGDFGEDLVKRRQAFDRSIIENASSYSEKTVAEAISGLYFQRSVHDVCLDLGTIVNYCESKKIENQETAEIAKLYKFFSGRAKFSNPEEYQAYVEGIQNFLVNFDTSRMHELINQYTIEFKNELKERLVESKEKVFSAENQIEVKGAHVPVYKLQNLTDNQRNFLLLVHAESYEKAKQYYQREFPGISLSVLDDEHLHVFKGGIIFGYINLENGEIAAVNTFDGQTNQKNIFNDKNNRVMAKQLYSVDDYMENTDVNSYNEIALKFADKKIQPKFIVSFNEKVTEEEIEIANLYKIPILIICREKYPNFGEQKIDLSISHNLWYNNPYGRLIEKKNYMEQQKNEIETQDIGEI